MWDIFRQFLVLGLLSFGGPVAHVGYFHRRFVVQLGWLDEARFAQLMALTQFLPGPASSQLGFAIGRLRGGLPGALAAFIGFTLPSFVLMVLAAVYASQLPAALQQGLINGLKWLAVVVVMDALLSMAGNFCQRPLSRAIALFAALLLLLWPGLEMQLLLLLLAALLGWRQLSPERTRDAGQGGGGALRPLPLLLFAVLLVLALGPLPLPGSDLWQPFYTAGSLVFGGGHVVLPLLQGLLAETLTNDQFLTGYAAAQAVPGPMFTLAAYLGALLWPASPWLAATLATLAIFLPGFLLVLALMDSWQRLASRPQLAGAVAGINAAVVGLLLAALINPVWLSAVNAGLDLLVVLVGFALLRWVKLPVWALVLLMAGAGIVIG